MKIMHEQLSFRGTNSFNIKWDEFPHFTFPWHFHSEYELVYVKKSFGKRFVADHAADFYDGDLVLLGSNLPHFWKNDEAFLKKNPELKVNAIVIHFPANFFQDQLENYPEFFQIRDLLKRASHGIHFDKKTADRLDSKLNQLLTQKGLEQTLAFLGILDNLAKTKQYHLLASESYQPTIENWSNNRLDKVMHIINSNYRQQIKLDVVANYIGMNTTSFCRYFKEKTGKTFIEFVNEMRIGYACKLILEGKQSVSQICFESGFNNLSNFNRCFKKNTNLAPGQYRNQFHQANQLTENQQL